MNRLKDIWGGQDDMNRVLFLIAVAVFVWSLIEGHGMYGALMAGVVLFLMVSRHGQRLKRFSRLYGTLYFPMPDGELVPRTFEQVKTEYLHGAQGRYAGRAVELRFPWWYLNSAGEIDTGFGLTVRLAGSAELLDEAKRLTEEGLDEAYYHRIINANFGAAMRALNSFESIAVSMAEGCFHHYDPYRFPEAYDSITQQDVLDFIRDSFTERGMALSIVYPKEG